MKTQNFNPIIFKRPFLILLLFFFKVNLFSGDYFDSQGKDFWFTFIPNYHNCAGSENCEDSLYILITSLYPTRGTIDYYDGFGTKYTKNFQINDPRTMFSFQLPYLPYELESYNNSGVDWGRYEDELVVKRSFHIVADTDITVYALSQANTTSDAFLVLPTDVLGNDYLVMAYNSDGGIGGFSRTPSQFAVVASEDSTHVQIIPSTATYAYNNQIQNILLNKGEVYLVQAKFTTLNDYPDLTGSEVHSDKPVAVFAGQQRATLPARVSFSGSRDVLIEQIPPVRVWGKNAFLVPYIQPPGVRRDGNDLYRILAAYDGTDVYINNVKLVTLDRGGYYEGALNNAAIVTANNAILVAQYKKTAGSQNDQQLSDPFMMIIPPVEQFMDNYRVMNVQAHEFNSYPTPGYHEIYLAQYIIIVSPDTAIANLRLDGGPVNQSLFNSIPGSVYSYANIPVKDGVHEIKSSAEVGVYVYGYGFANSYGYVGGMSFKPLDFRPPEILGNDSCFTVQGIAMDTAMNDSRISQIFVPVDSSENVNVAIEGFTPYKSRVKWTAQLNNFRKDGSFSIVAYDSIGHKTQKNFELPGFTLSLNKRELDETVPTFNDSTVANKDLCLQIQIHNYGKFPQTISSLKTFSSLIKFNYPTPRVLKPGQIDSFMVCFSYPNDTLMIDSLILENPCITQNLMNLIFKVSTDRIPPNIIMKSDSCNFLFNITITDSSGTDNGIKSIDTINVVNCSIEYTLKSIEITNLKIMVIDPYQDAFYSIIATDLAGNKSVISDTIPGFTISFPDWSSDSRRIIDFKTHYLGSFICDSFSLYNYGSFPIRFNNFPLDHNIFYSMPQTQFPVIINPKESKSLYVCYKTSEVDKKAQTDSIHVKWANCLEQVISITGNGIADEFNGESSCSVGIKMTSNKVPHKFMIDPIYPNPMMEKGTISFELPQESEFKVQLFNSYGSQITTVLNEKLKEGSYQVDFDVKNLENGMYFCTIQTSLGNVTRYFLISR